MSITLFLAGWSVYEGQDLNFFIMLCCFVAFQ